MDRILKSATVIVGSLLLQAQVVLAAEVLMGTQYDAEAEQQIEAVVQNRAYAGGQDEEDLKVQSELPKTVRKLGPTADIPPAPPSGEGF